MFVDDRPDCTVQFAPGGGPCGTPMFKIGTSGNNAWVCPVCDQVDVDTELLENEASDEE